MAPLCEVSIDCAKGFFTNRNDPLFPPFSDHTNHLLSNIVHIEHTKFADSNTRGIKGFKDGSITHPFFTFLIWGR